MVLKSLAALLLTAGPAIAQAQFSLLSELTCYENDAFIAQLAQYQAQPLFTGTGYINIITPEAEQQLFTGYYTVWTNQDTGFFVSTVTSEDGITCVLNSGTDFEPFSQ